MVNQINAVCVWDFTISSKDIKLDTLKNWLNTNCKKWCFQKEKGSKSNYEHYQGRISLKVKDRNMNGKLHKKCHWSATSNENKDNDFYCLKENTRIDGPWKNTDLYIPRQVREIDNLFEWQKQIINDREIWDTRCINVVICPKGSIGKSRLCSWAQCYNKARKIPIMDCYKDLMRFVMNTREADFAKGISQKLYLVDFPRSLTRSTSAGFWSALESIKDGYAWDDRYSFKEIHFDCPNIWVFSNVEISQKWFSNDRWKIWDVIKNEDLSLTTLKLRDNTDVPEILPP